MPRTKPVYAWTFSTDLPSKEEAKSSSAYHRVTGKKGKAYKSDSIPNALPKKDAMIVHDVHYGSHKSIERQIGEAMRELGL